MKSSLIVLAFPLALLSANSAFAVDMCNVAGGVETLAHKLAVLARHCDDVGRDRSEVTTTRLGTLVPTPNADETARVISFLGNLVGEGFNEQFTVGEPDDILHGIEPLVATGVDTLIFNMPLSDAATVAETGELLVANFG